MIAKNDLAIIAEIVIAKIILIFSFKESRMAVVIDEGKCTGCGVCVDTCPVSALAVEDSTVKVNDDCIECGVCTPECPCEALSIP